MFIDSLSAKDSVKIDTINKFVAQSSLKYQDPELYEATVKKNLRKVDEATKQQFDDIFGIESDTGVFVKKGLVKVFIDTIDKLINKIFKSQVKPPKNIHTLETEDVFNKTNVREGFKYLEEHYGVTFSKDMSKEDYLKLRNE